MGPLGLLLNLGPQVQKWRHGPRVWLGIGAECEPGVTRTGLETGSTVAGLELRRAGKLGLWEPPGTVANLEAGSTGVGTMGAGLALWFTEVGLMLRSALKLDAHITLFP